VTKIEGLFGRMKLQLANNPINRTARPNNISSFSLIIDAKNERMSRLKNIFMVSLLAVSILRRFYKKYSHAHYFLYRYSLAPGRLMLRQPSAKTGAN